MKGRREEGGRKGGREGRRKGRRKGGREGGREGGRKRVYRRRCITAHASLKKEAYQPRNTKIHSSFRIAFLAEKASR